MTSVVQIYRHKIMSPSIAKRIRNPVFDVNVKLQFHITAHRKHPKDLIRIISNKTIVDKPTAQHRKNIANLQKQNRIHIHISQGQDYRAPPSFLPRVSSTFVEKDEKHLHLFDRGGTVPSRHIALSCRSIFFLPHRRRIRFAWK